MTDDLLTFRSFGSKKCSILRGDTQRFTCRMSRQSAAKKTHLALVINLLTLVLTQAGSFAKWSFVPCLSCKCPMLIYLHTHIYTQTHTHTRVYIYIYKYIYIYSYIYICSYIYIYIYIYIYGVVHTVHLCINSWVWQTMTMDLWGRKKKQYPPACFWKGIKDAQISRSSSCIPTNTWSSNLGSDRYKGEAWTSNGRSQIAKWKSYHLAQRRRSIMSIHLRVYAQKAKTCCNRPLKWHPSKRSTAQGVWIQRCKPYHALLVI